MVLAIILGPLADENLRRALVVFEGKPWTHVVVDHPIGVILLVVVVYTFYDGIFRRRG
jgi:putative tricarboxylic transport membrane protein